jgi:hypothetical protein
VEALDDAPAVGHGWLQHHYLDFFARQQLQRMPGIVARQDLELAGQLTLVKLASCIVWLDDQDKRHTSFRGLNELCAHSTIRAFSLSNLAKMVKQLEQ